MGVVLITGGSRGIGAAVALSAAAGGSDVAITYRTRRDEAEAVVADCERVGARALGVQAEVADESDVIDAFDAAAELGPLTGFVNNAGIVEPQMRFEEMTIERLRRIVEVNVVGAMVGAREAIRRMSTRRGGHGGSIVNVSSAASRLGSPNEYVDYAATKGALDTLTLGLAREVGADGIRVNAVRPGLIETDIHASGGEPERVERLAGTIPLGRGGTADEVAELVTWLLSDAASYVSGALIDVSGGR